MAILRNLVEPNINAILILASTRGKKIIGGTRLGW